MPTLALTAAQVRARIDETTVAQVLDALGCGRRHSGGPDNWLVSAPYREDRRPSCSINRGTGLWKDFATQEGGSLFDLVMRCRGCELTEAVRLVAEWGAFTPNRHRAGEGDPVTARYEYYDEHGTLLYTVARTAGKQFYPGRSDGRTGYGPRRVLYRLAELAAADPEQWVLLCEGEKDADAAHALSLLATTSPGGANAWRAEYAASLRGRRVAIVPHNDEPGWRYARQAAASLHGVADEVRIVELPGLGPRTAAHGLNLSDWLTAGHDEWELQTLIGTAAAWTPAPAPGQVERGAEPSWPPLGELRPTSSASARITPELLPTALRGWLLDVAQRACAPLETVAAPAIVALAAVVGRQLAIRPKRLDSFNVVPNLWGMDVAPPGSMKSARVEQAFGPINALAAAALAEHSSGESWRQVTRARLEAEAQAVRQELVAAARRQESDRKLALEAELQDLHERQAAALAPARRLLVADATVEKLSELLSENPRGLLLYRDELSGFLRTLDRRGREGDRQFFLESWNGTNSYTTDRIGRGTRQIPALCLSIYGTIQPHTLQHYVDAAVTGNGAADGLLQRFQLLIWADPVHYEDSDRPPDEAAYAQAERIYTALHALDPAAFGAQFEPGRPPYLRFSEAAQPVYNRWRDALEQRLRSNELDDMPAFAAHLGKYRSLLPSLALLFHLVEQVEAARPPAPAGVSSAALAQALGWMTVLEEHARRVYAVETGKPSASVAALSVHIEQGDVRDGMLVREVQRRQWRGLRDRPSIDHALDELEQLNWLRLEVVRPSPTRPSRRIRLHPDLREP